jgi:tetratricopeptide (TPR) repeat protein
MNRLFIVILLLLCAATATHAQDSTAEPTAELPASYTMYNFTYIPQTWNNCGPATLAMGLTYYGLPAQQEDAAAWLKPNGEDKNVSPWQMVQYVNDQVAGVSAIARFGGNLELAKTLMLNGFPVIIEMGYNPDPDTLGWMGHYLLLKGWDDTAGQIISDDSYDGENYKYSYETLLEYWQHFNYKYIVLFRPEQEQQLMDLLGTDADLNQNYINSLEEARAEALANPADPFAWFNMGTNFVALEMYNEAAVAYDQAISLGLPWRMMWYQFGPMEAYNAVGRYEDTLTLAQSNLNDGGGQFVEETFYYGGVAREGLGQIERAIENYRGALAFNPNFTPAREALARLGA